MAVKTDSALTTTLATNITTPLNKQNTATRVTEIVQDIIDSKVNKDSISYATPHNTIYVDSVNGSDVTGVVENASLPFATINAANVASVTHLTATATDRVVFILRGYFNENIGLRNYHNYDINSSYINGYVLDSVFGAAVNCNIYGKGVLANAGNDGIVISYGSTIYINIYAITSTIRISGGGAIVDITADIISATSSPVAAITSGNTRIRNATVSSTGSNLVAQGVSGAIIFSNCQLSSDNELLKTSTTASNSSTAEFRRCKLYTSGTNFDCVKLTTTAGGNVNMLFTDCAFVTNGTGACIKVAQATNVRIHGSCQSNLTYSGAVTFLVGTVANGRFLVDTNVG